MKKTLVMDAQRIDHHWSAFFGLTTADFLAPSIVVVPHAKLEGYNGIWLFRRNETAVISAPGNWVKRLNKKVDGLSVNDLMQPQTINHLIGHAVEQTIGPAWHGYAEKVNFRPWQSETVRPLFADDETLLQELANSGDPQGWEDGGFDRPVDTFFGCFAVDRLVAVSRYIKLSPHTVFPGVFTHPEYRGCGFGKRVLNAAFEHALSQNYLIAYQTLVSNTGSIKLAEALGCKEYAHHIAIRLKM